MNQDVLYISFFEMLGREGYLRFASTLTLPFLSRNCITAAIFPLFPYYPHAGHFVTIVNLV